MNITMQIGRLTKDPEIRYSQSGTATCRFTLAVDRPIKQGEEKKTDFIPFIAWGVDAENLNKYKAKGDQLAILGRIQTGSYKNKDGQTVYTTDIAVSRIEYIGGNTEPKQRESEPIFTQVFEDIMF